MVFVDVFIFAKNDSKRISVDKLRYAILQYIFKTF